jgi:hypothetical protein
LKNQLNEESIVNVLKCVLRGCEEKQSSLLALMKKSKEVFVTPIVVRG